MRDLRVYDSHTGGPFADEQDFNRWLTEGTFAATPSNLLHESRRRLPSNHRTLFAHGDLGQQNIMVKDNTVVALVDWDPAGWFPEYWDFFKSFARSASSRDWYEYDDVISPETYFEDILLFQFLFRYQIP